MLPEFKTPRLHLRPWQPEADAADAIAIYGTTEVTRWLGESTPTANRTETQSRLQRYVTLSAPAEGTGSWAVVNRETATVIGNILLIRLPDRQGQRTQDYEIGWHFSPASWGQGYATEAAQTIMTYGLQHLQLAVIYAVANPANRRSIRVMERLGMRFQGMTDQYYGRSLVLYARQADTKST